MNLKHKLQIQFEEETKIPSVNSQKEFDIDYVHWLENKVSDLKQHQEAVSAPSEGWVVDKTPEDYQEVLVLLENGEIFKAMFCDDVHGNYHSQYFKLNKGVKITHWMPLPKQTTSSHPTKQESSEALEFDSEIEIGELLVRSADEDGDFFIKIGKHRSTSLGTEEMKDIVKFINYHLSQYE